MQGIGDVTAIDRESLRAKWESRNFDEAPAQRTNAVADDPLQVILGGLGAGLGAGLYSLDQPAVTVEADGQSVGVSHRLCMVSGLVI